MCTKTLAAQSGPSLDDTRHDAIIARGGKAVPVIATARFRNYEVEDEAISRLSPALSAVSLISHGRAKSDFVITMEPLVVQMYASPDIQVIDLESVDINSLRAMVSPGSTAHLLFVKEAARLSADDLNRYGEPIRFLLSLPSTVLQSNDRFQVVAVQHGNVCDND